jgi:hypothetical protein
MSGTCNGFVHRHRSGGPDTQTALALISAEARHLTLASVARVASQERCKSA